MDGEQNPMALNSSSQHSKTRVSMQITDIVLSCIYSCTLHIIAVCYVSNTSRTLESSVGVDTEYELDDSQMGKEIFIFSKAFRPALGPDSYFSQR
jgi:hypothetical protein